MIIVSRRLCEFTSSKALIAARDFDHQQLNVPQDRRSTVGQTSFVICGRCQDEFESIRMFSLHQLSLLHSPCVMLLFAKPSIVVTLKPAHLLKLTPCLQPHFTYSTRM